MTNATLETSAAKIGRAGPVMLALRLNTDREQDALRASVLRRRPRHHTDYTDDDEHRAEDFPGESKYSEVEIPIPHTDPHRVAAVLKVYSVAAIDALRALLDDAEAALTERYPEQPPAEQAAPATSAEPEPGAIEPTPEQLAEATEATTRMELLSGASEDQALFMAEYLAGFLASTVRALAADHRTGARCGVDRCRTCALLGDALAMVAVAAERRVSVSAGGEPR